jgi:hypothetical protein
MLSQEHIYKRLRLVYHREETIITSQGYEISLIMKLWQTPFSKSTDFPEGYKIS